jgi:multidrug transporter EmrE-like cation transporter
MTSFFESLKPVALLSAYVALSCIGLYLLKAAPVWLSLRFGLGFLLYALGAVMWLVILRHYPLSLAFPVAAGALMLGTSLIGLFFLGETLTRLQAGGALVILLGITMLLSPSPTP